MPSSREISGRLLRFAFLIVILASAGGQATYTADLAAQIVGGYPIAAIPPGDRIVAVEGRPVKGRVDLAEPIHARHPGDSLAVTALRARERVEYRAPIQAAPPPDPLYYEIGVGVVMPWFCLLLGFWVTAVRIRDPRAWMILGILIGMSLLTRSGQIDPLGWGAVIGVPALVLRAISSPLWAVSMMLFGIYFPQRWSVDRKLPWLKWVLLAAPAAAVGLLVSGALAEALDAAWSDRLPLRVLSDRNVFFALCPCISVFFASISQKFGEATQCDDKRRLRLLYWGASAALSPMFLLFLFDLIFRHRTPSNADGVVALVALLAIMIFPLTLAYVVVVQRAMDVGMVIRQGFQYALATRGVRVLQAVLVIGITLLAATMSSGVSRPRRFMWIALGLLLAVRIRDLGERLRRWVDRKFFREAYNAEQILGDLSEQVRGILDRDALLETVGRKIADSLHVTRLAILLRDGDVFRPALGAAEPVPAAFVRGDGRNAPVALENAPLGFDAQLVLPLPTRKELIGLIALGPKKSEEPYSQSDRSLLQTVAAQTGLALENANLSEAIAHEISQRELLHREIEIAREVQQRLFPQSLPEIAALEYAGHCRPARGVGGDYYDFLALASGRLGIAIGDVSGKGVPAALLMASLQASVRGQSQSESGRVAELMGNVNRLVCEASPENRYATFFYGQFDPASRRLVYSNGGHNNPVILRGPDVLRLDTGGPPVGLFSFSRYQQDEVQLEPGDLLVLFTDGVSEAENPAQDEWGEDALIGAARDCRSLAPVEIITRLMEAADAFAAGAPQHDDMTLVVARVG